MLLTIINARIIHHNLPLLPSTLRKSFQQGVYERRKKISASLLPYQFHKPFILVDAYHSIVLPRVSPDIPLKPLITKLTSPSDNITAYVLMLIEALSYLIIATVTAKSLGESLAAFAPSIPWIIYPAIALAIATEVAAILLADFSLLCLFQSKRTLTDIVKGSLALFFCLCVAVAGIYLSNQRSQGAHRSAENKRTESNEEWRQEFEEWKKDKQKIESELIDSKSLAERHLTYYLSVKWESPEGIEPEICESSTGKCKQRTGEKVRLAKSRYQEARTKTDELQKNLDITSIKEPKKPESKPIPDASASKESIIWLWLCLSISKVIRHVIRMEKW